MTGGKRKDPAWKYGTQFEVPGEGAKKGYIYLKCNFCDKRITGGVKRLKDHIGGTHRNAGACEKVSDDVKKECLDYMKCYSSTRQAARRIKRQMTGSGSSFGAQEDAGSCPEGGGCGGVGGGGGGSFSGTRGRPVCI